MPINQLSQKPLVSTLNLSELYSTLSFTTTSCAKIAPKAKQAKAVKKIFLFRLCTLADRLETEGEDNFGLTYNVFDEEHSGEPKPAAIALAQYINGADYDVASLYKFAKK